MFRAQMYAGISNTGNTCYVAAVVQCLANCSSFMDALARVGFHRPLHRAMYELCVSVLQRRPSSPDALLLLMRKRCSGLITNFKEPNDSHEFLTDLVAALDAEAGDETFARLFLGRSRTSTECTMCRRVVHLVADEAALRVTARGPSAEAVPVTFETANINDYRCEGCARVGRAVRESVVTHLPPVIVAHAGEARVRLTDKLGGVIGANFELVGAVCRAPGHYYAIVRDGRGSWLLADDEVVTPSHIDTIAPGAPFLIFLESRQSQRSRVTPQPIVRVNLA